MRIFNEHPLRKWVRIAGTSCEATGSMYIRKIPQGFPNAAVNGDLSKPELRSACSKLSLAPAWPPVLPLTVP